MTEKYHLNDDVRYRRVFEEGVIVIQDQSDVVVVNDVAMDVLELLETNPTVEDIVENLYQRYDIDRETLRADVQRHLDELLSAGVISE